MDSWLMVMMENILYYNWKWEIQIKVSFVNVSLFWRKIPVTIEIFQAVVWKLYEWSSEYCLTECMLRYH